MAHKLKPGEEDREGGCSSIEHGTSYRHSVELLSDDLIEDLSGRLSSDWYKLGIELSVDVKIIDKLYNRGRIHADRWPFRLLQEWRKRRHQLPLRDQVIELAQALEKIHRGDLVYALRHATEEGQNRALSDRLLMQLAEGINQEWYNLGIHLEMSSDKLDSIKMEEFPDYRLDPGADLLKVFREKYSGVNIVHDLQQALRGIRRLDLARYIDEKSSEAQWKPVSVPLHGSPKPRKATVSPASYQDVLPSQSSETTSISPSSYQSSIALHRSHIVPSSVDSSMLAGQSRTSTIVTSGSVYSQEKK